MPKNIEFVQRDENDEARGVFEKKSGLDIRLRLIHSLSSNVLSTKSTLDSAMMQRCAKVLMAEIILLADHNPEMDDDDDSSMDAEEDNSDAEEDAEASGSRKQSYEKTKEKKEKMSIARKKFRKKSKAKKDCQRKSMPSMKCLSPCRDSCVKRKSVAEILSSKC